MRRPHALVVLLAPACQGRPDAEPSGDWWGGPDELDVVESVAFTDEPYPPVPDGVLPIAELRATRLDPSSDNDGPRIATEDWHEGIAGCAFWEQADDLPVVVEGIVTAHPRVYRKIEGCDGDEKYYGSYWLEDASGGLFVLRDSKVATFTLGARVRLDVRGVRRRYGEDMIYVASAEVLDPGPLPIHYTPVVGRVLGEGDVGRVARVVGTVVAAPSTFGEVLLQPDDVAGTCAPDDELTRASCLLVELDTELNRRGVTFAPGDRLQVTAPVGPATFFAPSGIFTFYGAYVTRLGQIQRLDD